MKIFFKILMKIVCIFLLTTQALCNNIYKEEFEYLKNCDPYKKLFSEDLNPTLRDIQSEVLNFKNLTSSQKSMYTMLLDFGSILVTPENMPQLHRVIDAMSKDAEIVTPAVFITIPKWSFGAMVTNFFTNPGIIVVGQKLLLETTDAELEAVVAHEIGHMKYNHVYKKTALYAGLCGLCGVSGLLLGYLNIKFFANLTEYHPALLITLGVAEGAVILAPAISYLAPWLINKKMEDAANEFADKILNKGDGLKSFFETQQNRDFKEDSDFYQTYALIKKSKDMLSPSDYTDLLTRYKKAEFLHKTKRTESDLNPHTICS